MSHDPPRPPGRTIRAEMHTSASPEAVWEAWTDPAKLSQWFTDGAAGEARAGSTMRWDFSRVGASIPYAVVEAAKPRRLVLGPVPGAPPFLFEIDIEHQGGTTQLRLVNSGFSEDAEFDDQYGGIDSGWRMALAVLKLYVEQHFGEPREQFFVMRPARFDYEGLFPYYVEEPRLAAWLTRSGKIGGVGEPVHLVLQDGQPLNGRTLAKTSREVAVSWSEFAGLLQLKAFAAGPGQRMLCVSGWGWGLSSDRAAKIESYLEAAVERLAQAVSPSG